MSDLDELQQYVKDIQACSTLHQLKMVLADRVKQKIKEIEAHEDEQNYLDSCLKELDPNV